jgi:predicted site-specific integrase-resolvase
MKINYKTRKEACEILGIHYHSLYKMANNMEIETIQIGKNQMYNVDKYIKENSIEKTNKRKICYCRVSSQKQKPDLKRQIEYMENKYPSYEIISDIGSGLNLNRIGLNKIMDYAIKGEIEVIIIAYKDRLARFGYDMIERIVHDYSDGIIKIEFKTEEETPTEEISKDIISIMNIYVAKINGLRKYKKNIKNEVEKQKKQ